MGGRAGEGDGDRKGRQNFGVRDTGSGALRWSKYFRARKEGNRILLLQEAAGEKVSSLPEEKIEGEELRRL